MPWFWQSDLLKLKVLLRELVYQVQVQNCVQNLLIVVLSDWIYGIAMPRRFKFSFLSMLVLPQRPLGLSFIMWDRKPWCPFINGIFLYWFQIRLSIWYIAGFVSCRFHPPEWILALLTWCLFLWNNIYAIFERWLLEVTDVQLGERSRVIYLHCLFFL